MPGGDRRAQESALPCYERRLVITLCATALGAAALLDRYGRCGAIDRANARAPFDAIVVLGCRVFPDGRPSLSLERRARRAAELFHEGLARRLVTTGGLGDAPITEAAAAARIARSMGVPEEALVREGASTTTRENAMESARIIGGGRVLLVTDSYHVFRAERVFRRHFDVAIGVGALGPRHARLRGALREVVAVTSYAARGLL